MKKITYAEATEQNLTRYFTGIPCIHGHVSYRQVSNRTCGKCVRQKQLRWQRDHKEQHNKTSREYRQLHPDQGEAKEKHKKQNRKWKRKHKKRTRQQGKLYRQAHQKEIKTAITKWRAENPLLVRAHHAKRRAAKLHATPRWADLEKIKEVYVNCPKGFEVDHIVPLQGKAVCGLHVPWNLQYLTQGENCSKGNKLLGEHQCKITTDYKM